jgi:hypothetical protein
LRTAAGKCFLQVANDSYNAVAALRTEVGSPLDSEIFSVAFADGSRNTRKSDIMRLLASIYDAGGPEGTLQKLNTLISSSHIHFLAPFTTFQAVSNPYHLVRPSTSEMLFAPSTCWMLFALLHVLVLSEDPEYRPQMTSTSYCMWWICTLCDTFAHVSLVGGGSDTWMVEGLISREKATELWYRRAIEHGYKNEIDGKCSLGSYNALSGDIFLGPIPLMAPCHSSWALSKNCDALARAITTIDFNEASKRGGNANLALQEKSFPVGTTCFAQCIGMEGVSFEQLGGVATTAAFTCGEDGHWIGQLLCPSVHVSSPQHWYNNDELNVGNESVWRAEDDPALPLRWQLATSRVEDPTRRVACAWVDTRSVMAQYLRIERKGGGLNSSITFADIVVDGVVPVVLNYNGSRPPTDFPGGVADSQFNSHTPDVAVASESAKLNVSSGVQQCIDGDSNTYCQTSIDGNSHHYFYLDFGKRVDMARITVSARDGWERQLIGADMMLCNDLSCNEPLWTNHFLAPSGKDAGSNVFVFAPRSDVIGSNMGIPSSVKGRYLWIEDRTKALEIYEVGAFIDYPDGWGREEEVLEPVGATLSDPLRDDTGADKCIDGDEVATVCTTSVMAARYLRIYNLRRDGIEGNYSRTISLFEIQAFGVDGSLLPNIINVAKVTMSSTRQEFGSTLNAQGVNCIDEDVSSSSRMCHTAGEDTDPWLEIDFGSAVSIAKIMVTNGNFLGVLTNIVGAEIALTTHPNAKGIVWNSSFVGALPVYAFDTRRGNYLHFINPTLVRYLVLLLLQSTNSLNSSFVFTASLT